MKDESVTQLHQPDQYRDPILEQHALAALLADQEAAIRYLPILLPAQFSDANIQRLFTILRRMVHRSSEIPSRTAFAIELRSLYPTRADLAEGVLAMYDYVVRLTPAASASDLVTKVIQYARVRQYFSDTIKTVDMLRDGQFEEGLSFFSNAALATQGTDPTMTVTRGEVIDDYEKRLALMADMRLHPEKYRGILTGLSTFDGVTGGLWDGELGFCFGRTGVGKSFFLLQVAYSAYIQNKTVLVIPIEMPLIQWQRRFDARLSKIAYEKFKWATLSEEEEARWSGAMLDARAKHTGKIFVTHIPIGCPLSAIKLELEMLKQRGEPADLLVIDYGDLMSPQVAGHSEQNELTEIFQDLKGLATSSNIPIWTASQAKRSSKGVEQLTVEDVGYASGKANASDVVVGIAQSDTDDLARTLYLTISKYRDGSYNKPIICNPNFAISMIHDAL